MDRDEYHIATVTITQKHTDLSLDPNWPLEFICL